jgi:predicted DNA-binding protein (UPF0278 family)
LKTLDIFDLYRQMESNNILLSFKGAITSELLSSVLQIMESKMEDLEESLKTRRKVFNVLVECLQNLYHHIDDFEVVGTIDEVTQKKSAIFLIAKNPTDYSILTGNFLLNENVEKLRGRIDLINSFDREELKEYYKTILNNGEMSSKGGGGLGFIDIAKKSGEKLEYNIIQLDEKYSFFTLIVKIEQI